MALPDRRQWTAAEDLAFERDSRELPSMGCKLALAAPSTAKPSPADAARRDWLLLSAADLPYD